jgi:hypothetical protein
VTGLGAARLFDVTCTRDPKPNRSASAPANRERIRALYEQHHALSSEKEMRDKEAEMLLKYGGTLSSDHVSPQQAIEYMDAFVQRKNGNIAAGIELKRKIKEIKKQIEVEEALKNERKGSANVRATMVVATENDTPAMLKLIYSES